MNTTKKHFMNEYETKQDTQKKLDWNGRKKGVGTTTWKKRDEKIIRKKESEING